MVLFCMFRIFLFNFFPPQTQFFFPQTLLQISFELFELHDAICLDIVVNNWLHFHCISIIQSQFQFQVMTIKNVEKFTGAKNSETPFYRR